MMQSSSTRVVTRIEQLLPSTLSAMYEERHDRHVACTACPHQRGATVFIALKQIGPLVHEHDDDVDMPLPAAKHRATAPHDSADARHRWSKFGPNQSEFVDLQPVIEHRTQRQSAVLDSL